MSLCYAHHAPRLASLTDCQTQTNRDENQMIIYQVADWAGRTVRSFATKAEAAEYIARYSTKRFPHRMITCATSTPFLDDAARYIEKHP
jgi:hypothetical protein